MITSIRNIGHAYEVNTSKATRVFLSQPGETAAECLVRHSNEQWAAILKAQHRAIEVDRLAVDARRIEAAKYSKTPASDLLELATAGRISTRMAQSELRALNQDATEIEHEAQKERTKSG